MLENSSTDSGWFHAVASRGSICLVKGRISFYKETGEGSQNRNAQTFFYLGSNREKFERVFLQFGLVGQMKSLAIPVEAAAAVTPDETEATKEPLVGEGRMATSSTGGSVYVGDTEGMDPEGDPNLPE